MSNDYGFGPLGSSTVTLRPDPSIDGFGKQTWFKDATGAGKNDGTVITASFLNNLVGNLAYLCRIAGVSISNSSSDTYVYLAIQAIASNAAAQIALIDAAARTSIAAEIARAIARENAIEGLVVFDHTADMAYADAALVASKAYTDASIVTAVAAGTAYTDASLVTGKAYTDGVVAANAILAQGSTI